MILYKIVVYVGRDLKCENILLDVHNNVKLTDFGFCRFFEVGTLSKTFCGSAAYAAPEILQGIAYTCPAYDVWSAGVILYIMVCGSMPYDDSNVKRMIKYQTERRVGFPTRRTISNDVKVLIHGMLEADVNRRLTMSQTLESPWLNGVVNPLTTTDPQMPPATPQPRVEQRPKSSPMVRPEAHTTVPPNTPMPGYRPPDQQPSSDTSRNNTRHEESTQTPAAAPRRHDSPNHHTSSSQTEEE